MKLYICRVKWKGEVTPRLTREKKKKKERGMAQRPHSNDKLKPEVGKASGPRPQRRGAKKKTRQSSDETPYRTKEGGERGGTYLFC